MLNITLRPPLSLILTISKTSNIAYVRRCDRVRVVGRDHPTWMFNINPVGIILPACICNDR
jgi:hypothetical protein